MTEPGATSITTGKGMGEVWRITKIVPTSLQQKAAATGGQASQHTLTHACTHPRMHAHTLLNRNTDMSTRKDPRGCEKMVRECNRSADDHWRKKRWPHEGKYRDRNLKTVKKELQEF